MGNILWTDVDVDENKIQIEEIKPEEVQVESKDINIPDDNRREFINEITTFDKSKLKKINIAKPKNLLEEITKGIELKKVPEFKKIKKEKLLNEILFTKSKLKKIEKHKSLPVLSHTYLSDRLNGKSKSVRDLLTDELKIKFSKLNI